ncbi:uncharacterized protein LOC141695988 [Apium graveolens]|uniref:uncharacterized protein LOC141695988 n=1 Tax=Apium graveolens TaxID=4045 RepID=UPI003D7B1A77
MIAEPKKKAVENTPPESNTGEKHVYPPPPYPKRLHKQKFDKQFAKFLEVFKKLHVNIPFAEALEQMSSYAKFMKADRSIAYPRGIVDDVMVKEDRLIFSANFVILDFEEDKKIPIILGRPILDTGRTLIDVQKGELTMRTLDQEVTFNVFKATKFPTDEDECLK